jgi:hypothetical protein
MLITSRQRSLAIRKVRSAKNAAFPDTIVLRETPRFLSGSPGSFQCAAGLPGVIQLSLSDYLWPGPCRIQSRTGRGLVGHASSMRYFDEAVDDLAAAWREKVRPFPAKRVHEEQSPAVFRILGRFRENGRAGVGIEYLDEQAVTEMPYRQPYQARFDAPGILLCRGRIADELDRVRDKLGDQQFCRVGSVSADSPARVQEQPNIPACPERGGRQRGERECSGVNRHGLARLAQCEC